MMLAKIIILHHLHQLDSEESETEARIGMVEVLAIFLKGLYDAKSKLSAVQSQLNCYCGDVKDPLTTCSSCDRQLH
jgi:hypothetical protein